MSAILCCCDLTYLGGPKEAALWHYLAAFCPQRFNAAEAGVTTTVKGMFFLP